MQIDGKQIKPASQVDGVLVFNTLPAGSTVTVAPGITMLLVQTLVNNGSLVISATGRLVGVM